MDELNLTLPEDLSALTGDEIAALEAARVAMFAQLRAGELEVEGTTPIAVAAIVSEQVAALRAETERRSTEAAAVSAEFDRIAATLEPAVAVEGGEGEGEPAAVVETPAESAVEPAVAVAPVAAVPAVVTPVVVTPELVSASVATSPQIVVRPRAFAVDIHAASAPVVSTGVADWNRTDRVSLVAAGDFNLGPGGGRRRVKAGDHIDFATLGQIAAESHRVLGPVGHGDGRVHFATANAPYDEDEILTGVPEHDSMVIEAAVHRAQGGSAAGLVAVGHCAPPVNIYTFANIATVDGLANFPFIRAERGAVAWPTSPTLAPFMAANVNWLWTAVDDANPVATKSFCTIDCAVMQAPCVVEDHYWGCTFKNMTARSWPEMYANHIRNQMTAHQYRVNRRLVDKVVAGSTAVPIVTVNDSLYAAIVSAVELQVVDLRDKYYTNLGFTFEALLPHWMQALLRADLARRKGVNMLSVTDAEINAGFVARGIRPQFIRGLQDINVGGGAAVAWPATLKFVVYPAGTWMGLEQGRLDLGMEIRDSTLIAKNAYMSFVEDSMTICKVAFESRVVTVSGLDVCGLTGGDLTCPV